MKLLVLRKNIITLEVISRWICKFKLKRPHVNLTILTIFNCLAKSISPSSRPLKYLKLSILTYRRSTKVTCRSPKGSSAVIHLTSTSVHPSWSNLDRKGIICSVTKLLKKCPNNTPSRNMDLSLTPKTIFQKITEVKNMVTLIW